MTLYRKSLVILFPYAIGLILTSCVRYRIEEGTGRCLPKRPNFRLAHSNRKNASNGVLNTHALYVRREHYCHYGRAFYYYYRFFDTGHVMHRSCALTREPTVEDGNSFEGCDIGYYTVDGKHVTIELFVPHNGGSYIKSRLTIEGDSLIDCGAWLRDNPKVRKMRQATYVIQPMEGLITKPDW